MVPWKTKKKRQPKQSLRVLLHLLRGCKLGWFWGVSDPFSGGTYWTLRDWKISKALRSVYLKGVEMGKNRKEVVGMIQPLKKRVCCGLKGVHFKECFVEICS